jgi:hypothetical protein
VTRFLPLISVIVFSALAFSLLPLAFLFLKLIARGSLTGIRHLQWLM